MIRKIGDKYQSYCATYKCHAMTTHRRETGHTGKHRDLNSHIGDARGIDIGPDNDNESMNSLDTMITFGDQRQMATSATSCLTARQT